MGRDYSYLDQLKVTDLKEECARLNLPKSGKKQELKERVINALVQIEAAEAAAQLHDATQQPTPAIQPPDEAAGGTHVTAPGLNGHTQEADDQAAATEHIQEGQEAGGEPMREPQQRDGVPQGDPSAMLEGVDPPQVDQPIANGAAEQSLQEAALTEAELPPQPDVDEDLDMKGDQDHQNATPPAEGAGEDTDDATPIQAHARQRQLTRQYDAPLDEAAADEAVAAVDGMANEDGDQQLGAAEKMGEEEADQQLGAAEEDAGEEGHAAEQVEAAHDLMLVEEDVEAKDEAPAEMEFDFAEEDEHGNVVDRPGGRDIAPGDGEEAGRKRGQDGAGEVPDAKRSRLGSKDDANDEKEEGEMDAEPGQVREDVGQTAANQDKDKEHTQTEAGGDTTALLLTGWARPINVSRLTSQFLEQYGPVSKVELSKMKETSIVIFETIAAAKAAYEGLHGKYVQSKERAISAEFVDLTYAKESLKQLKENGALPPRPGKPAADGPPARRAITQPEPGLHREGSRGEWGQYHEPGPPEPAFEDETQEPGLDELFRKTKNQPAIYYLPLSDRQVARKRAMRARGEAGVVVARPELPDRRRGRDVRAMPPPRRAFGGYSNGAPQWGDRPPRNRGGRHGSVPRIGGPIPEEQWRKMSHRERDAELQRRREVARNRSDGRHFS